MNISTILAYIGIFSFFLYLVCRPSFRKNSSMSYNKYFPTLVVLITFMVLLLFQTIFSKIQKEGFTWDQHLTQQFLDLQSSINPSIVFDPEEIRRQASEKELEYFIKHKKWPWSKNTENLYIEALNRNPYIRTFPDDAISVVRSIYNERAILEILSWQTKEGNFLIKGVHVRSNKEDNNNVKRRVIGNNNNDDDDNNITTTGLLPNGWGEFAYNSGQLKRIGKHDPLFKCAYDKDGNISMSKIYYKGENKITGIRKKIFVPIANEDIESAIPGFEFLQQTCNPCEALNKEPNYNCPFTINTAGTVGGISGVWKYLWGI